MESSLNRQPALMRPTMVPGGNAVRVNSLATVLITTALSVPTLMLITPGLVTRAIRTINRRRHRQEHLAYPLPESEMF